MSKEVKVAIISGIFAVLAAMIGGLFTIVSSHSPEPTPKPTPTIASILNATTPTSAPIVAASVPTATPTPTPLPTPTPSPTPVARPGTVLYQADWSSGLDGWVGTSDWKVLNGMLLNDGSGNPSAAAGPTIVAPFQPATADYAVEVRIQEVRGNSCFDPVTIRGSQGTNGWQGYKITVCEGNLRISSNIQNDLIAITPFDSGNSWHLYRVEAKGIQIKVFIDGGLALEGNDNRYLSAGQVGIKSSAQLIVSSFKIIVL